MKILIMGFTKPKYMPYMNFYLDNISREGNEIHILYWNRDQKAEDLSVLSNYTLHEFKEYQEDEVPIYTKFHTFLKYRKFASKIIKRESFDFIIVLHTLPGVLVADLLKKYKGRFILDYRDSTYERFAPFKKIIGKLVKWSKVTFVSSDGFRKYLPVNQSGKIKTSHNILLDSLGHQYDKELYGVKSDKIRISFWGFIRHKEVNINLIDCLANDNRFELHYYGREQQIAHDLKKYVKEIGASNIFFHGEYKPSDRYKFILETDIIHNLYQDNNTLLAMGNKFYDGIIFRIPQICMPGSFMGNLCEKYDIGVALNPNDRTFSDLLFKYYNSIKFEEFNHSCKKALYKYIHEYEEGCSLVKKYTSNYL